ncbi:MAG: IS701 family transposase [Candidatus Aenigmatarchaeota archaeon]
MIPIISPPSWITDFVSVLPLSYHQIKHMTRYATGLIVSRTKTVAGMSSLFLSAPSSRAMNYFIKEYEWNSSDANSQRLAELQNHNETRWNRNGIGIIDDTIIEKTGKHIPGIGKYFDHAKGRYVYGHNLVSLHYADRKTNYPIDYRLYVKKDDVTKEQEFKTKIQFAKELVEDGISMGMPVLTYVFDSWYTCNEFTEFIESFGKFWIGSCESSLLVRVSGGRFVSIAKYDASIPKKKFREFVVNGKKLFVYTKLVYFNSLGRKARLIISKHGKDTLYLATNRKDHAKRILAAYMWRGKIDAFYRDTKQHLGLGRYQFRDIGAIKKHWHIVFLSHSLLRLGATESVLGRVVLASTIGKSLRRTCIELIEQLLYYALGGSRNVADIIKLMMGRV